jgi:ABC-type antimicrobial peptide transport system permease subunit
MQLPYLDPSLMPDFPGMADAENCRDWNTGLPINTDAIRPKDEDYWHKYRGAPKAFVTLHAAQSMWTNRFGTLTAIRYPNGTKGAASSSDIAGRILSEIHPRDLGFIFQPVREQALAASSGAQDFGGLFIGFSFFLIAAALILISLLFRFALEQRGGEVGILLALGFPTRKVRRLLVLEGLGLAILGGIIGTGLAVLYARAMLYGLSTIWSGAVAGANLSYHGEAQTLAIGFASSVIISVLTIWWSLRREGKRSARELLSEGFAEDLGFTAGKKKSPRGAGLLWICGACAAGLGIAIAVWGLMQREQQTADTFFSAGALVLIGGLILASALIRQLGHSSAAAHLSLTGMGVRGITRRRQRSRAAIGLLACGAFLIASIGVFHLDSGAGDRARSSGTGGFALVGDASIPIVQDLNSKAGREFFNLTTPDLQDVHFVPFRVSDGEDASCLNLNRALRPRILGVNPELLNERHAFTFNKTLGAGHDANPWLLLNQDLGPGVVPAIGDAASIQWALGKSVGDELDMTDANGQTFHLKIVGAVANSILQGSLIISEQPFIRRFPNDAGYRMFLIDAPVAHAPEIARTLTKAMQDAGFEAESASSRLAAFNAVQNTYLGTFQILGGLGLLLGTFGLGIILLRNVYERRSELALLLAVGFQKSSLRKLVLSEHAMLLVVGLFIGIAAAVIAVLPSLLTPGARLPLGQLGWTLGAVFLCGLVCTVVAASSALRAPLLKSLRNE